MLCFCQNCRIVDFARVMRRENLDERFQSVSESCNFEQASSRVDTPKDLPEVQFNLWFHSEKFH